MSNKIRRLPFVPRSYANMHVFLSQGFWMQMKVQSRRRL